MKIRWLKRVTLVFALAALTGCGHHREIQFLFQQATEARARGDLDSVISCCDTVLRMDPGNARAYRDRGQAYYLKGDLDQAILDYDQAIQLDPQQAEAFLGRGRCYERQRTQADGEASVVLRLAPADIGPRNNRSIAARRREDEARALRDFGEAIQLDPRDARAYTCRGQAYTRNREYDKAIADFRAAIRLDPTNSEAYAGLGFAYGLKGDYGRALDNIIEAGRLEPGNAGIVSLRAYFHFQRAEFAEAHQDYDAALRLDSRLASAHNGLAWLLATCPTEAFRNGKQAVEEARAACRLTGWNQSSYVDTLAAACAEAGDFAQAVKYQKQLVRMNSVNGVSDVGAEQRLALYEQHQPYHTVMPRLETAATH